MPPPQTDGLAITHTGGGSGERGIAVLLHGWPGAASTRAAPDLRSAAPENKVKAARTLPLPAMCIQGTADGVAPPAAAWPLPERFAGPFKFVTLPGVGHFALARHHPFAGVNQASNDNAGEAVKPIPAMQPGAA